MPFPNPDSQFKPGQSGNPGGRPRGRSITALIREFLDQDAVNGRGEPIAGKTYADLVAESLVKMAASGDTRAAKELLDRLEGKARSAEAEERLELERAKFEHATKTPEQQADDFVIDLSDDGETQGDPA